MEWKNRSDGVVDEKIKAKVNEVLRTRKKHFGFRIADFELIKWINKFMKMDIDISMSQCYTAMDFRQLHL